jgi:hypothetical protein
MIDRQSTLEFPPRAQRLEKVFEVNTRYLMGPCESRGPIIPY